MGYPTDGQLPRDANGALADSVYVPGVGTVAAQGANVATDAQGTNYAQTVVTTATGSTTAIAASNTGLPVNVPLIVQKKAAVSTGSVATLAAAFTNSNVAGNSIIVVAGCGNGTAMTVADSVGNTYTSAIAAPNSTTFEAQIFYAVGILAGTNTVTVTNAGATASMAVEIYEVSGLLTQVVAQPDQTSIGTGTSATPSIPAVSPNSPNSLAFMGVAVGTAAQAVSVTAGTLWTLDSTQNTVTPAGLFTFGSLSQFLGTTAPVVPKATIAGSEPFAIACAVFKPVVLGVSGIITQDGYNYTHVTTAQTGVQLKTGAGILHAVVVNTHAASATLELDDALSHTNPIAVITSASGLVPITLEYDVRFSTGLNITSVTTADWTIVWK